jgi:hypothetical protein
VKVWRCLLLLLLLLLLCASSPCMLFFRPTFSVPSGMLPAAQLTMTVTAGVETKRTQLSYLVLHFAKYIKF